MAVDNNAYFRVVWQFPSSTENGKLQKAVSLEGSGVREEQMSEQTSVISENKAGRKYTVFPMLKITSEHLLHHRDAEIWQKGHLCKNKSDFFCHGKKSIKYVWIQKACKTLRSVMIWS